MEEKEKKKQERNVIHLYFKDNDSHEYFGSMANIFEFYTKDQVGIGFGSLRNYGLSPEKPYINNKVIIRKGTLQAKPKKANELKEVVNEQPKGEVKPTKIFNKEQLTNYLLSDEIVHFDEFRKKGFIEQSYHYVNLVNAVWHIYKANQKKNSIESSNYHKNAVKIISKIFQNEHDIQYYTKRIDTKLDKCKTD